MKLPPKSESTIVDTVGKSRFTQVEYTERYPQPCLEGAQWGLSGFLCSSCVIF